MELGNWGGWDIMTQGFFWLLLLSLLCLEASAPADCSSCYWRWELLFTGLLARVTSTEI